MDLLNIEEHGTLCLFGVSRMVFSKTLSFSSYRSYPFIARLVPMSFTVFVASMNRVFLPFKFSN